jgi:hypothetical protein
VHEVTTGRELLTLPQPDQFGGVIALTPDGQSLVTATFTPAPDSRPDGQGKMVWGPGGPGTQGPSTLRLWELATGKQRLAITSAKDGYDRNFSRLAVAPDGRTLVTVRNNQTIRPQAILIARFWSGTWPPLTNAARGHTQPRTRSWRPGGGIWPATRPRPIAQFGASPMYRPRQCHSCRTDCGRQLPCRPIYCNAWCKSWTARASRFAKRRSAGWTNSARTPNLPCARHSPTNPPPRPADGWSKSWLGRASSARRSSCGPYGRSRSWR